MPSPTAGPEWPLRYTRRVTGGFSSSSATTKSPPPRGRAVEASQGPLCSTTGRSAAATWPGASPAAARRPASSSTRLSQRGPWPSPDLEACAPGGKALAVEPLLVLWPMVLAGSLARRMAPLGAAITQLPQADVFCSRRQQPWFGLFSRAWPPRSTPASAAGQTPCRRCRGTGAAPDPPP